MGRLRIAALVANAPSRAALADPAVGLPNAQLVVEDPHVSKLANAAIEDVRRRVQQESTGNRGHRHDPLFPIHELLLSFDGLDETGAARLQAALAAGDPYEEVTFAQVAKQLLRSVYGAGATHAARVALSRFYD